MGSSPSAPRTNKRTRKRKENGDLGRILQQSSRNSFILGLNNRHLHVVNAGDDQMLLVARIVRSHCTVVKEGWVKHITYAFKMKKANKTDMILLMSNLLFALDQNGWDPLAPVESGKKKENTLTTICFVRRPSPGLAGSYKSLMSYISVQGTDRDTLAFCLEQHQQCYLIFHSVPNTVLSELVQSLHTSHGIAGVSRAVFSVIEDYSHTSIPVLPARQGPADERWVRLARMEDTQLEEQLENSIIACLIRQGYRLSIPFTWDTITKMFFFVLEQENKDVRQLSKAMVGVGSKDSLSIYRPIIKRSKSSFFRSFNSKTELNRRLKNKLKKQIGKEPTNGVNKIAWYQQTSTDIGTDYDDDDDYDIDNDVTEVVLR